MRGARSMVVTAAVVVTTIAWAVDSASATVSRVVSGYRALTAREQATHVLNRLAFGPRPGEVDRVVAMGVDRWIEQQLQPERTPDREMERLMAMFPALRQSAGVLLRNYPPPLRGWPPSADLVGAPRTAQVDAVIEAFLAGRASPETREILVSGNNPLMERAASDSAILDPGPPAVEPGRGRQGGFERLPQLNGLAQVIGLALGSPEFQRR